MVENISENGTINDPIIHTKSMYPNQSNKEEQNMGLKFISAAKTGKLNEIIELLDMGCPIEFSNENGWTALSCAAFSGQTEIVTFLLGKGANDFYLAQNRYNTIQGSNIYSNLNDTIPNENKNEIYKNKNTPLHWACYKGHIEIVWILLKWQFNIEDSDTCGNTSLHLASQSGHYDIVQILLANGANIGHKNKYGNTPLNVVTHSDCKRLLLNGSIQKECSNCQISFQKSKDLMVLCQQCLQFYCNKTTCSTIQEISWNEKPNIKRPFRYCKRCLQDIQLIEKELKNIISNKLKKLKLGATKNEINDYFIKKKKRKSLSIEKKEDNSNSSELLAPETVTIEEKIENDTENQHNHGINPIEIDLSNDMKQLTQEDIEPLYTSLILAKEKGIDINLINHGYKIYYQLSSIISLYNEMDHLNKIRPISCHSTCIQFKKLIQEIKLAEIDEREIIKSLFFLRTLESELTLFGYKDLCDRIIDVKEKDKKDIQKLAIAVNDSDYYPVHEKLKEEAIALRLKLLATLELKNSIKDIIIENNTTDGMIHYKLPDGVIETSLLKALEHRLSIINNAIEKAESAKNIQNHIIENAVNIQKQIKKDLRDEQKRHDEKKRQEEETLKTKSSKKGKKPKK